MKKITTFLTIVLMQTATLFASNENDTLLKQKQCFYDAKIELENMLSGKIPLDYERAVFITENAYWNNEIDYTLFKSAIDLHTKNIKNLAETNRNESLQNFKLTLLETEEQKREKYQNLLYNWAIFTYLTDTTILKSTLNSKNYIFLHFPYKYSYADPLGVLDWKNSQVFNLLDYNKANCYAMTSFYKIFAERFNTDACIGSAPGHVYITHIDQKGTHYNIELANRAFPGAGSIMTLTYTPVEAVRNGIAMRTLNLKQSVALCLIYLAKGYEHKFDTKTDNFIYQCAETTLKYDSLNLNAMLLKAEVLEEKVINKNKTIQQLQTDNEFKVYQNLTVSLFEKGYREMPLDMKNLIINRLQKDSANSIFTDHTPKGFQTINPKDDRYATLSWGMFDEVHEPKLIEQYSRTLLNTKTKKITKFVAADSLYNKYPIDPVVFAWQIDPLASKYPNMSPYVAFADNPIYYTDPDGRDIKPTNPEATKASINLISGYDKNFGYDNALFKLDVKNDKERGQIIGIEAGYTLKDFQKNAKKMGYDLSSDRYKDAESVFKILESDDIIEIAVIGTGTHTKDIPGYTLETQNEKLNSFKTKFEVDKNGNVTKTPTQSEINNFLQEGTLNGEGYGYFPNTDNSTDVSGILIVNPVRSVPMLDGSGNSSPKQAENANTQRAGGKILEGVKDLTK